MIKIISQVALLTFYFRNSSISSQLPSPRVTSIFEVETSKLNEPKVRI